MTFNTNELSNYRYTFMVGSMFLIALYHGFFRLPGISWIFMNGNIGVDVFLFFSGYGLFFSLSKHSLHQYYRRRIIRIIPYYLPLMIAHCCIENYSIKETIFACLTLRYWILNEFYMWFVPAIIFLYFLAPILMYLYKKYGATVLLLMAILSFFVSYIFKSPAKLLLFCRIPVFIVGMYFGSLSAKHKTLSQTQCRVLISIAAILIVYIVFNAEYAADTTFGERVFVFLMPGLVIVLVKLMDCFRAKKSRITNKPHKAFDLIKQSTLCYYLVYEFIYSNFGLLNYFLNTDNRIVSNLICILFALFILVIELIYFQLINSLLRLANRYGFKYLNKN